MARESLVLGIIAFIFITQPGSGYESKWTRVDGLAKSLTEGEGWTPGEAARRLEVKEQIMEILYMQEAGYPIFYVDPNATGNRNGTSWANAFAHIQDGVDAAYNNGEGWVWVAQGLYTFQTEPRGSYTVDGVLLKGVIQLLPKVMLFGGFSGNETQLDQRNPDLYKCFIQGWIGTNVSNPGLRGVDMAHQTLLDGFTVQYSGFNASAIRWETDGGGIKTRRWFSVIRNNRVTGCYGKNGGGIGIQAYYSPDPNYQLPDQVQYRPGYCPIVERNVVYRNFAACGGGCQIRDVEALFCHNIVAYNRHDYEPGGMIRHKGVEVYIADNVSDRPILVNNIVWGNVPEPGNVCFNIYHYNNGNPADTRGEAGFFGYKNCVERPTNNPQNANDNTLLDVNPLFVNAYQNDFTLQPGSPCIGQGLALPDGTPTDIGFYAMRYQLTIDDGGVGATKTGHGMQLANETVAISTDSLIVDAQGTTRYLFQQWSGSGAGSYTGSLRSAFVVMQEEITETIGWKKEFWLDVQSGTAADDLTNWYNDKAGVNVTVPATVQEQDTRRVFSHWNIDKNGTVTTSASPSLSLVLDAPVALTAVWNTEYRVVVQSTHGSPNVPQEQWKNAGSNLSVTVASVENGPDGTRYVFQQWQGQGASAYTGNQTNFAVTVNSPIVETAVWQTQYYLNCVANGHGSAQGAGWYEAGGTASFAVDSLVQSDSKNRYRFAQWQGSGSGSYTGTVREQTVVMNNAVTETVVWNHECLITTQVTPPNTGIVTLQNTTGEWGTVGSQVTFRAEGDADAGYGFAAWSGSYTGRVNPLTVQISQPVELTALFEIGNVHVATEPQGLSISVNGADFPSPRTFYWLPGEQYTLGTATPQQTIPLTRYVFDRWSDNQGRQHLIVIPADPVTYTAFFNPEYGVEVQTEHGSETVQGDGWVAAGARITLSVDSLVEEDGGSRYRFTQWTAGNEHGTDAACCRIELQADGGIVQNAHWQKQYHLNAAGSPAYGGHIEFSLPGPWYDEGTLLQLTAVPVDTHFTFTGWSGDLVTDVNPVSFSMNQAVTLKANFTTSSIFPPEVKDFPDTTLLEDIALVYKRSRLEKIISDKNDPLDSLHISVVNGAPFQPSWNGAELRIVPDSDWNGTADVVLEVMDPWGMAALDTFSITIIPIPDPPKAFSLVAPLNHTELPDSVKMVAFRWRKSRNVDSGDGISYEFFLGPDSLFQSSATLRVNSVQDTFLILNRNSVASNSYWRARAVDHQGFSTWSVERYVLTIQTSVEEQPRSMDGFSLDQNYPNPFNACTQIQYSIPERSHVRVTVYNMRGGEVCTLLDKAQAAGSHRIEWSGKDDRNMDVPSGVYLLRTVWKDHAFQRKMILVR